MILTKASYESNPDPGSAAETAGFRTVFAGLRCAAEML